MEQKKFSVQVEAQLSQEVETYCSAYAVDEQEVIHAAISEFLSQRQEELHELIDGYQAMASINSEICEAFSVSESEAYSHIQ
ncbi:hypothetical protein ACNAN0_09855 [Agrilactobacillus fermenti]|uniref:hypothetical protein n=1 Tax=Agrilactobacillus fermenti TaxID=2586909 RepID=UPI001E4FBC3B|nr:hypothetical protein [Agrilactobacillus fermenti]MCD2255957.1 hypothetical protein [Agrilactobacillus fermenti]